MKYNVYICCDVCMISCNNTMCLDPNSRHKLTTCAMAKLQVVLQNFKLQNPAKQLAVDVRTRCHFGSAFICCIEHLVAEPVVRTQYVYTVPRQLPVPTVNV